MQYLKRFKDFFGEDDSFIVPSLTPFKFQCTALVDILRTPNVDGQDKFEILDCEICEIYLVRTCKTTFQESLIKIDAAAFIRDHRAAYREIENEIEFKALNKAKCTGIESGWKDVEEE